MSKLSSKKSIFSNPIIRKMKKMDGVYEGDCATYKGIFLKSLYFLLMVIVGAALAFTLANSFLTSSTLLFVLYGISLVLMLVCGIVAGISPKTTPVTGTLSSLAMGYATAFTGVLIPEYSSIYYLAIVLTLAIVLAMMFVYFSGIVKVTNNFRKVLYTALLASIIGSLILVVCFFIPATRIATVLFLTNPVIAILVSVIEIILASLFLLVDFNDIERTVEARLPQSFEWLASFSLIITIVWLYLEILDLLLKIKDMVD
ncbi:MAG: Bax inhibitor-1/YccA family protein [Clostridia bacterium]|nr:Bax inhibitor-1/YccA family protein [Clostridia bacterium]